MKYLLLLLLAVAVGWALLCWQRNAESAAFAVTAAYCHVCEDGNLDWGDQDYWEATGTLEQGRAFFWASRGYAVQGVRRASLHFEGFGVAYLITNMGQQRIVGQGDYCAAYTEGRVFVVIRGLGTARAVYDDGINNGCW